MYVAREQNPLLKTLYTNSVFYRVLFFIMVACAGVFLFHHQAKGLYRSDLLAHINFIDIFVKGSMKAPEVGFQYTIYTLSRIMPISYANCAVVLLTVMLLLLVIAIYKILNYFLPLTEEKSILFTFLLMTMSAIYLPFFNKNIYLGQGSPNVWHNPTLFMVKPFAFAVMFLTIYAMEKKQYIYWSLSSLLLLISMYYKPSFAIVFIPALAIYLLINHLRSVKIFLYALLMVAPAVLYCFYQYYMLLHYGNTDNAVSHSESIIFSKFGVLRIYTPNVFVSFLLGLAFPLSILLFRFKSVWSNNYLKLCWIMLIIAYLQMAFLAEYDPSDNQRFASGNFMWGFLIALQPLFVFSFIEFYQWLQSKQWKSSWFGILQLRLTILLLALHVISGLFYTIRIFRGGGCN